MFSDGGCGYKEDDIIEAIRREVLEQSVKLIGGALLRIDDFESLSEEVLLR
jgi:hypothetical protein